MSQEQKRKLRVFLNYASEDREAVMKLYQRLVASGVEPWLDIAELLPGQKWQLKIDEAIASSDAVIVCISKRSITKEGYVQKEIKDALGKLEEKPDDAIYLIPAKIEECEVPGRLSELQWVNLFDENSFEKLIQALCLRAERVNAFPPTLCKTTASFPKPSNPPKAEQRWPYRLAPVGFLVAVVILLGTLIFPLAQRWLTKTPGNQPTNSPAPVSVLSPNQT